MPMPSTHVEPPGQRPPACSGTPLPLKPQPQPHLLQPRPRRRHELLQARHGQAGQALGRVLHARLRRLLDAPGRLAGRRRLLGDPRPCRQHALVMFCRACKGSGWGWSRFKGCVCVCVLGREELSGCSPCRAALPAYRAIIRIGRPARLGKAGQGACTRTRRMPYTCTTTSRTQPPLRSCAAAHLAQPQQRAGKGPPCQVAASPNSVLPVGLAALLLLLHAGRSAPRGPHHEGVAGVAADGRPASCCCPRAPPLLLLLRRLRRVRQHVNERVAGRGDRQGGHAASQHKRLRGWGGCGGWGGGGVRGGGGRQGGLRACRARVWQGRVLGKARVWRAEGFGTARVRHGKVLV